MSSFDFDIELKQTRPLIDALSYRMGHPEPAAVYQDVCIAFWRQSSKGAKCHSLRGWVKKVALNAILAWRRRESRAAVCEANLGIDLEPLDNGRATDSLTNLDCLHEAISRLPSDQAAVVEACLLGTETIEAYASRVGLKRETARTRLKRGLHRLRVDPILSQELAQRRML
jgi:RNA polymerase sigma factor (sigma-70 family)